MKSFTCLFLVLSFPLSALLFGAGGGAGYFGAWKTGDALRFPFAPGIAVNLRLGVEGKNLGLATRLRFGLGGALNPLSSAGTGDLTLYALTLPLWAEYPVFSGGTFGLFLGFSTGPGVGFFRDNIRRERAQTVIHKVALAFKAELRTFYPTVFWLEAGPSLYGEFTRAGVSSTLLLGGEILVGFSNEY